MYMEPDVEQRGSNKCEEVQEQPDKDSLENQNNIASTNASETCCQTECLLPRKQRERRNKSPIAISTLLETFAAPLSPASSSCTSLGNSSADATFEPSVDMMVNDFDDEQTLNEEEALAAMEHQDPNDEIATLQEESDMPLEELLAKYQVSPPVNMYQGPSREKKKRLSGGSKHSKHKKINSAADSSNENKKESSVESIDDDNPDNLIETVENNPLNEIDGEDFTENIPESNIYQENEESWEEPGTNKITRCIADKDLLVEHSEKSKARRTHLMDLYPEESFTDVLNLECRMEEDGLVEHIANEDDEVEDVPDAEEEEEEEEFDSDYVKKTIMVGPSYQATIPDGLSQYGDVLPYENEDKLIWEPSQVSERQVEEYLLKARDIKPSLLDNVEDDGEQSDQVNIATDATAETALFAATGNQVENNNVIKQSINEGQKTIASAAADNGDGSAVIKDNEQALHLLVQCGYDFKEALRRKRLNALPLTGSMSLWSEEECHKFEEGIQKFGKDFFKIRQNQVRTRTMRELVQFYYLWKKSDRRDHNFANSDTVDHMDIYLNEGGDYSPTPVINGVAAAGASPNANGGNATLGVRKNTVCIQKNSISIMMTGSGNITSINTTSTSTTSQSTQLNAHGNKVANNRKRSVSGVSGSSYENPLIQGIPLSTAQMK